MKVVVGGTPRAVGAKKPTNVSAPPLFQEFRRKNSILYRKTNRKLPLGTVRIFANNNSSSEYPVQADSTNSSENESKHPQHSQTEESRNKFRGSYSKESALATSSDNDSWDIYPLTTLQDASSAAIESWPSSAARDSLYSTIPVDRCDGLHFQIHGKIPLWLKGSLYRNGPGHFKGASAVFDGCAMIARFKINGGGSGEHSGPSVVVSHRFIETTYLAAARAAGGDVRWTLGQKSGVRKTALERLKYIASLSAGILVHGVHLGDNALISIFPGAKTTATGKKELIAHTETLSGTYRIDPDTLETLGRVEYIAEGEEEREKKESGGDNVSGLGKTAHPHVLPNGDVINLACDFMPVASKAAGARLFVRLINFFSTYSFLVAISSQFFFVP
jgi:hypothetical protein